MKTLITITALLLVGTTFGQSNDSIPKGNVTITFTKTTTKGGVKTNSVTTKTTTPLKGKFFVADTVATKKD